MPPSFVFLAGALLSLIPMKLVFSQEFITIHASVVLTRTGERTPVIEQWQNIVQLTSTGAQQAYAAGTYLRDRYMPAAQNKSDTSTAIDGLSPFMMNPEDLYILAPDSQYIVASATAFMQGLYPSARLNSSTSPPLQPNALLANGSYVSAPLGGYQYAWIHTASNNDPESIYVNGENHCPEWNDFNQNYFFTPAFNATMTESEPLYSAVGGALADFNLQQSGYQYWNAYAVYDYLSFMYVHNTTYFDTLNAPSLVGGNAINQLRYLADQFEYAIYGNLNTDPDANRSEISTIAGQTFATKTLELLAENILAGGAGTKLNLLFGEYPAFLSFFALANLSTVSSNFTGLPEWGSSMIFELFSYSNSSTTNTTTNTTTTYPPESDLHIRFLFRNGTTHPLLPFPLFATSTLSLPWLTFRDYMLGLTIPDVGARCSLCGSVSVFCAAWNTSAYTPPPGPTTSSSSSSSSTLTPKTAGVIGAIATLSALCLLLIMAVGFGGLRFKRVDGRRKSHFGQEQGGAGGGGFKGGRKLASDVDLTLGGQGAKREGKGGGGIVTVEKKQSGKERVGSWEMEETQGRAEVQMSRSRSRSRSRPRSGARKRSGGEDDIEDEDGYVNPMEEAVRPEERV